jgi:hypothetical protein
MNESEEIGLILPNTNIEPPKLKPSLRKSYPVSSWHWYKHNKSHQYKNESNIYTSKVPNETEKKLINAKNDVSFLLVISSSILANASVAVSNSWNLTINPLIIDDINESVDVIKKLLKDLEDEHRKILKCADALTNEKKNIQYNNKNLVDS